LGGKTVCLKISKPIQPGKKPSPTRHFAHGRMIFQMFSVFFIDEDLGGQNRAVKSREFQNVTKKT
jgi:hypothetical protein